MKIFLDTADTEIIRERFETGLIDGITTNPSLIRKSGRDPEDVYQEIKDMGVQDISMEVVGDAQVMLDEGLRLVDKFGSVATIKLPMTKDGLLVCRELTKEKIRTNVTLIFCAAQAVLAAKAGATYVSPFIGRLDDISTDGLNLIAEIRTIYDNYGFETEILAASVRHIMHIIDCAKIGADVMTGPLSAISGLLKHPLTDIGLAKFLADYKKGN